MTDQVEAPLRIHLSRPVGLLRLWGGAIVALLSTAGLVVAIQTYSGRADALAAADASLSRWFSFVVIYLIGGATLGAFAVLGAVDCRRGLVRVLQPVLYSDGPSPFRDAEVQVPHALRDGKTRDYLRSFLLQRFGSSSLDSRRSMLNTLFGQNSVDLSPSSSRFVAETFDNNKLKKRIAGFLALAFLLVWLLRTGSGAALIPPIFLLLVGCVALTAVEYLAARRLIPAGPRVMRADHLSRHYKGFGHPTHLYSRVPVAAQVLALPGFPNRVDIWDQKEEKSTVADVGQFSATLFIERQPEALEAENSAGGLLLLHSGWSLRILAVVLLLLLFTPVASLVYQAGHATILTLSAVVGFFTIGTRHERRAVRLLDSTRYRSIGLMIAVSGTVSRADVRIGGGASDFATSANLAARSDFTAEYWSAELLSEAQSQHEPRDLLEVRSTEESKRWVARIQEEVDALREERVRPVGLDTSSAAAGELAAVSQEIFRQRASLLRGAGERHPVEVESPKQALPASDAMGELVGSTGEDRREDTGELKECPECAEEVRMRARRCRFCGYRFDEGRPATNQAMSGS